MSNPGEGKTVLATASSELPPRRRFTELEAELKIDADMLMDWLSDVAQRDGKTATQGYVCWVSPEEAAFLYRCAQVFRNE